MIKLINVGVPRSKYGRTDLEKEGCFMNKNWTKQHKASDQVSYHIEAGVMHGGNFNDLLIIFHMVENSNSFFIL